MRNASASVRIFLTLVLATFPAAAIGQSLEGPTESLKQRFTNAMTFEQFLSSDTARATQWRDNVARARTAGDAQVARAQSLKGRWHLLIVAENWCSDAVNTVPYLVRLGEVSRRFDVRLLRKADAPDLLGAHLIEGRSATPLVLVLDSTYTKRSAWIERPSELRAFMAKAGQRYCEDDLKQRVRAWYEADAGRAVSSEVLWIMEHIGV